MPPKVTVLMPVYNGERFLRDAIESMLRQTFDDFELLIVNDGSTDGSRDLIRSYADQRIRLVEHEKNRGIVASLNTGIECACGEYLARMDADDVSLPHRLDAQVAFMEAHPEVGVCGGWVRTIDAHEALWQAAEWHEQIKIDLLFKSAMYHPVVMMRTCLLTRNRYDEDFLHVEDYRLWLTLVEQTQLHNLQDVLLLHRIHHGNIGAKYAELQKVNADRCRVEQLQKLHIQPTPRQKELHCAIAVNAVKYTEIAAAKRWLRLLTEQNKAIAHYHQALFDNTISTYQQMLDEKRLLSRVRRKLRTIANRFMHNG